MKLLIAVFVLFFQFSFCQLPQKEYNDLIKDYLEKTRNVQDIHKLMDIIGDSLQQDGGLLAHVPTINPVNPKNQKRISSTFGNRFHPIDGKVKPHLGLDIAADAGTPVHASADGIVAKARSSDKGMGNYVEIDNGHGFTTRYGHMYLFIVELGQRVKKGDIIGFVGSTGKSTGNHLHYGIIKNGRHIDPYPFCFLGL